MKKLFSILVRFTAISVLLCGCGRTSKPDEMSPSETAIKYDEISPYEKAKIFLHDNDLNQGISISDGLVRCIEIYEFDSTMSKMDVFCDILSDFLQYTYANIEISGNMMISKTQIAGFSVEDCTVFDSKQEEMLSNSFTIKNGDKVLYKCDMDNNSHIKSVSYISYEKMLELVNASGIKYEIIKSFNNKQGKNAIIYSFSWKKG